MSDVQTQMRWIRRGVAAAVLAIGWLFIGWKNNFHLTAPVVFVGLGYLAVVATVYNLWRTGAAAVADDAGEAWSRPAGARGELDKEKRTLLKAIKEAEFDHEMGKLSKADADDLIRTYRARAIEVIKELDRLEAGQAGTVREQIDREVKARLELAEKKAGKKSKAKPDDKPEATKAEAAPVADEALATAEADEAKAKEATS